MTRLTAQQRQAHIETLQGLIEANRTEGIEDSQTLAEYCLDNQLSQKLVNSLYKLLIDSKRLATEEEAQREEEPIFKGFQNPIINEEGKVVEMSAEDMVLHILEPIEDVHVDDLITKVTQRGFTKTQALRAIDKLLKKGMIGYRMHDASNTIYACWRVDDIETKS